MKTIEQIIEESDRALDYKVSGSTEGQRRLVRAAIAACAEEVRAAGCVCSALCAADQQDEGCGCGAVWGPEDIPLQDDPRCPRAIAARLEGAAGAAPVEPVPADRCAFCPGEIPRDLCKPIGTFAICQGCADWLRVNGRTATVRSLADWHEDDGAVLWWKLDDEGRTDEAPWVGTPLNDDWPCRLVEWRDDMDLYGEDAYYQHWTPLPPAPIEVLGASEGPPCESCGQPADGRSADDVPLCSRCEEALAAEQEGHR